LKVHIISGSQVKKKRYFRDRDERMVIHAIEKDVDSATKVLYRANVILNPISFYLHQLFDPVENTVTAAFETVQQSPSLVKMTHTPRPPAIYAPNSTYVLP
jgi:hypothetical protein